MTVDEIAPGYVAFAKEVLNIDLEHQMFIKQTGLRKMSNLDLECLMTAEEFLTDADDGMFYSDDGNGYWATKDMISGISCFSDQPEWATHVCWFNK